MEKQQIREAYKIYYLENGQRPVSVYAFCKQLNIPEKEFYKQYNSMEAIDRDSWLATFTDTLQQLQQDNVYQGYSAREKLLAFYFTWVQRLREDRSYILLQKDQFSLKQLPQDQLRALRRAFYDYAENLIRTGYETGEIKERKYISDQYVHGFWLQALFVLNYWIHDTSDQFVMTDAAIEKAVDLSFKFTGNTTLDSLVDFGKFIFTRK